MTSSEKRRRKNPPKKKKKKVSVGKSNTPARKDEAKEEKNVKGVKKVAATPQRTNSGVKVEKTEPAKSSEAKEPKPKVKPAALKLITKERSASIGEMSQSHATSSDVQLSGLGTPPTPHRDLEQVAPAFSPRHRLQRTGDGSSHGIVVEPQPVVDSDSENNSEAQEIDELDSDEDDEWGSDGEDDQSHAYMSNGSLSERIRLITEECTAGLGREKFERVKELMELLKLSEDDDDVKLEKIRAVIGTRDMQKFTEKYASLITTLMFCEEAM